MTPRIIRPDEELRSSKVRNVVASDPSSLYVQDKVAEIEALAFRHGYLEGERAGMKVGMQAAEAASKKYSHCVADMASAYRSITTDVEKNAVLLAVEIARKILQRELSLNPDVVAQLTVAALQRVQSHAGIRLRVHRGDLPRVREAVLAVNPAVTVEEDASLQPGDFLIDTAQTHLDGRIDSQVDALQRAMLGQ